MKGKKTSRKISLAPSNWAQEWEPSPARRVLHENHPLWHPMATTKGRPLLEPCQLSSYGASLLLLACGDPLEVLHTANAVPPAHGQEGRGSNSSAGSGCQHLDFHLNDRNPVMLARTALLLALARETDTEKDEDMDLLWAAWYHVRLTAAQLKRVQATARHLAASADGPGSFLKVPRAADLAELKNIWALWGAPGGVLDGSKAAEDRANWEEWLSSSEIRKEGSRGNPNPPSPAKWTDELLELLVVIAFSDREEPIPAAAIDLAVLEVQIWIDSGITLAGETTDVDECTRANVTFLDPRSWKWEVQGGSTPFHGYLPLSWDHDIPSNLRSMVGPSGQWKAEREPPKSVLANACKEILRGLVRGLHKWLRKGDLRISLWGGDALGLCLYQMGGLSSGLWNGEDVEGCQLSAGDKPLQFDVISASNLGDHVGLLNVLLCAGPLLKRHPFARLQTQTSKWAKAASTPKGYMDRSLAGIDLRLLPSLLGLRLCTNLVLGTGNTPAVAKQRYFQRDYSVILNRVLEWAPVSHMAQSHGRKDDLIRPTALALIGCEWSDEGEDEDDEQDAGGPMACPRMRRRSLPTKEWHELFTDSGMCGLAEALKRLAQRCCLKGTRDLAPDNGLDSLSGLTLALLQLRVLSLVETSRIGSNVILPFLNTMDDLRPFALGWMAMWRIIVSRMKAPSPLLWDSAFLSETDTGVVVFRGKMGPTFNQGNAKYINVEETPQIRLFILASPGGKRDADETHMYLRSASKLLEGNDLAYPVSIIDNFTFDPVTSELTFAFLTEELRWRKESMLVALATSDFTFPLGAPVELSGFEEMKVPPPSRYTVDVPVKRATGSRATGGMEVCVVCEFADHYKAWVRFPAGRSDAVAISSLRPGPSPSHVVAVKLGRDEAEMRFSWPVQSESAKLQVSRKRGRIVCTIPKAPQWPLSSLDFPSTRRVKLEAFPEWPSYFDRLPRINRILKSSFTLQEWTVWTRRGWEAEWAQGQDAFEADVFWNVRHSIHTSLDKYGMGIRCFWIKLDAPDHALKDPEITMIMHSIRKTPEGRPLLELKWRDHRKAKKLVRLGLLAAANEEPNYWSHVVRANPNNGQFTLCHKQEGVDFFRMLLEENSARMEASGKRGSGRLPPDWSEGFLTPLFPDEVHCFGQSNAEPTLSDLWGLPMDYQQLVDLRNLEEQLQKTMTGPHSLGWQKPPPRDNGPPVMKKVMDELSATGVTGEQSANIGASGNIGATGSNGGGEPSSRGAKTSSGAKKYKGNLGACARCAAVAGPEGEKLKKCARCRSVSYCSSACQKAHWTEHKDHCKAPVKPEA